MITNELFNRIFPVRNLNPRKYNLVRSRDVLVAALNKFLPAYDIDTHSRVCAFLACCGIETDYFKTSGEYASGEDYEGRADLGNTQPGDGRRFKGGGLIQTTGRYNFFRVSIRFVKKLTGVDYTKDPRRALTEADRLGVNFIKHPETLRDNIEIAVEAACIFWEENNLNYFADRKQFKQLNGVVNRGDKDKTPLHWDKRNVLYSVCARKVPADFRFVEIDIPAVVLPERSAVEPPPAPPFAGGAQPTETFVASPESAKTEPATDDNFLSNAIDRNVTPDELKTVARASGGRIAFLFSRPFMLLYAALELGNVWAWGGVILGAAVIVYLIYAHRADLKKVWDKIKNKFLQ